MDQELQRRIDEAKAAGYSDEEIQAHLGTAPARAEAALPRGPQVPMLSAEEKAAFKQAEQQVEDRNTGENISTGLVGAGVGAAAVGVPLALYKGAKAVLNPAVQSGAQLAQRGVAAAEQANATAAATEARVAANQAARAAQAGRPLGPVSPQATYNVPTQNVPQMRAPLPQGPVAPQNLQNQVRQQAASRIVGMGGAAAVPAAVGLGGAAATGIAGGQMAAMTPEQRKAYYDNMMLGAMGGDASLAAAIMNRGQ